ncbi:AAA family ATPase [Chthonobacter albigriseus]|uniref:AAA family ATPase n=1 Tax=Chthonobacter albigriseus TaxID=1683161 RepID=UPI0015EF2491|nr:AAA family ATPase [Chthonobacter albigriseus]
MNDVAAFWADDPVAPPKASPPTPRFRLEPLASIAAPALPAWHIRDLLPATGLSVIYGPPGSGKSFLALHAVLCLASGMMFAGKRSRPAGVVYIAAEAGEGFKRRVVAARDELGITDAPFALVSAAPDLGTADKDIASLITDVRTQAKTLGWSPGVVVIDTLARTIPGLDENSSREMGIFVANCDKLARALGCTVIAVHHSGKNVDSGMRGSSALHGAADAEWCISVDAGVRTVRLVKSKEGADNLSFSFDLKTVEVGRDADGEPVTTCVVENVTDVAFGTEVATKARARTVPASLKLFTSALTNALVDHGEDIRPYADGPKVKAIRRDLLRDEFVSRHPADNHTARKMAFSRAVSQAANRHLAHSADIEGDTWIWLA